MLSIWVVLVTSTVIAIGFFTGPFISYFRRNHDWVDIFMGGIMIFLVLWLTVTAGLMTTSFLHGIGLIDMHYDDYIGGTLLAAAIGSGAMAWVIRRIFYQR